MLPRSGPAVEREFPATPHAARDVADALAPLAADLGPELAADLRLLATELVANAVRHTGVADGTVELHVRLAGDVVHLSVADDGPGFEPPDAPAGRARGTRRLGAVPGRPVRRALGQRARRPPPRVARAGAPRCRLSPPR